MHRPLTKEGLQNALPAFKVWLLEQNGEMLKPTSIWEALRFRVTGWEGGKPIICVVYTNRYGKLTYKGAADAATKAWAAGQTWSPQQLESRNTWPKRRWAARQALLAELLQRDGPRCFLCHKDLGLDATLEHLLPKSLGGSDDKANMTLAHESCNLQLGSMSLMEKILARERNLNHETDTSRP